MRILTILFLFPLFLNAQIGIFAYTPISPAGYTGYPNSNRIAYYTAQETTGGITEDVTGNGFTGTLNSVTFSDGQLNFGGGDGSYVSVPNLLDTFPDIGSISFDYTPTGTDAEDKRFFSKRIGGTLIQFYKKATTGNLRFTEADNTTPDYTWNTGTQYRITITWEAIRLFIYINGVHYYTRAKPTEFAATGTARPFIVGAYDNLTEYIRVPSAKIDDFEVRGDFISVEKALSEYNGTEFVASTMFDKFVPQEGDIMLSGDGPSENNGILEPHVIKKGSTYFLYYTANYADESQHIHVATSTVSPKGPWTRYAGNPILQATHTGGLLVGDSIFLYAGGPNVRVYASADGFNFFDRGIILEDTDFPNISGFGNIAVADSAGHYVMMVECSTTPEVWSMHRATSASPTSGWTMTHKLALQPPSTLGLIQTAAGTTGGAWIQYIDGVWHMAYHFSYGNILPTYLAYATGTNSADLDIISNPLKFILAYPFVATDQVADPWVYVDAANNKVYLYAEYCNNVGIQDSHIRVWTFTGTLTQLITP